MSDVDPCSGMPDIARAKLNPSVTLTVGEAGNLPFAGETFGTVVCISALHYFQDPELACRGAGYANRSV